MADQKISELTAITGANTADDDLLVIVDTSASQTKKITLGELENALAERDFSFGDNDKLVFGAGSDLQIYHDGSNSYIKDAGQGNLYITATDLRLGNADNSKDYLRANDGGAVSLLYNAGVKLSTTSTGIDVTGTVTADGLTVDGNASLSSGGATRTLTLGPSGAGIEYNVSGTTTFQGRTDAYPVEFDTNSTRRMRLDSNGDISFYEDTGTTAKFFWDASAESLGIGTTSPSKELHVMGASHPEIRLQNTSNNYALDLKVNSTVGEVKTSSDMALLPGGAEAVRLKSDGKVGIGTSSPQNVLSINSGDNREMQFLEVSDVMQMRATSDSGSYTLRQMGLEGSEIFLKTQTTSNTSGLTRMYVASDGDVGIGTTSPATKLDVAGTTTTDGLNLDAISETISDTAVDIFVYDTRKDSDGGAWRKRTQHTSWYNETLNTSTRGSRKEFPAVAVIVAEGDTVTIYDGDDPSLPMWMVLYTAASNTSAVTALNSNIYITRVNGGDRHYNFVADTVRSWYHTSNFNGLFSGDISGRTTTGGSGSVIPSDDTLVSQYCNDVAMTVLPNAPIDAATGLPVPTIAVATDGGVSVIKDDGTVVDITHSSYTQTEQVLFPKNGGIAYTTDNNGNQRWLHVDHVIPSADVAKGLGYVGHDSDEMYHTVDGSQYGNQHMKFNLENFRKGLVLTKDDALASGSDSSNGGGIVLISRNKNKPEAGMSAEISSTFNTGWLVGGGEAYTPSDAYPNKGAVLATLSDTDDTNVTGSELVTNTALSDWLNTGATTWSSGALTLTGNTFTSNSFTTVSGKTYTWSVEITASSGTYADLRVGSSQNGQDIYDNPTNIGVGKYSVTFTATSNTTYITLKTHYPVGSSSTTTFDNISVRLAEEDRSVNGNGLQVFGTLNKTPVATGADLVAYSNWASTNYLEQPYNSDLNFGNNDICTMGWFKTNGDTYFTIFENRDNNSTNGWALFTTALGSGFRWRLFLGSQFADSVETSVGLNNTWTHFAVVRRGGAVEFWLNGVNFSTNTNTDWSALSASKTSGSLKVGVRRDGAQNLSGSLALLRISATAPSADQIKKIYEDEKVLFQEGAQATLYGSSDAVNALAYDEDTGILHVGTDGDYPNSGRSEFRGLRRVGHSDNFVGTAISASNGLVVEE